MHNSLLPIVTTVVCKRAGNVSFRSSVRRPCMRRARCDSAYVSEHMKRLAGPLRRRPRGDATTKKNAAGRPREYSQTPSDEGNKQLWDEV
ncbi:hypothetical protein Bmul_0550 [Burkholderia multivorans ATCC 17616]|nr:hypothetical protein Bmul_0550 [Burkholderia multivorans ATCC 17616]